MEKVILNYSYDDIYYIDKYIIKFNNLIINDVDFGDLEVNIINDVEYNILISDIKKYQEIRKEYQEYTDDELFKLVQDAVQGMLDMIARDRNYDDGFTMASYAESTIKKFREEALKFIEYRDRCWTICYDWLNRYNSGEIEQPTLSQILNQMPTFE